MANVKYNEKTYYVPSDKFLVSIQTKGNIHKEASTNSKLIVSLKEGQVFSVSSEVNGMYRIKPGWISQNLCDVLVAAKNELIEVREPFSVKIISNIPVLTEASPKAHTTTMLRVGEVCRVIGESEDFFQLETGDFIQKSGCRRY